jgi:dethiobiotin synthetase
MASGYYVTGTDTAVGKTLASVALLHALRARGHRGRRHEAGGERLQPWTGGLAERGCAGAASRQRAAPGLRPGQSLRAAAATAPQIAAAQAGIDVRLAPMLAAFDALAADGATVVVEGVGGWLAPSPTASSRRSWRRACSCR